MRYSERGSGRVSGAVDLCESTHTMLLCVWDAQPAMVRFSLTYALSSPFTTRYAPGLQKQRGPRKFLFCFSSWSPQREKGHLVTLWSNLDFPALETTSITTSKNEYCPPVHGEENHTKSTWILT